MKKKVNRWRAALQLPELTDPYNDAGKKQAFFISTKKTFCLFSISIQHKLFFEQEIADLRP